MEPVSTLMEKYYSLIWCVLLGLLGRYGGWWGKRKECNYSSVENGIFVGMVPYNTPRGTYHTIKVVCMVLYQYRRYYHTFLFRHFPHLSMYHTPYLWYHTTLCVTIDNQQGTLFLVKSAKLFVAKSSDVTYPLLSPASSLHHPKPKSRSLNIIEHMLYHTCQ
jgi:hypothetical protein